MESMKSKGKQIKQKIHANRLMLQDSRTPIGVVMLVYLDEGYERWVREGRLSERDPVGILLFRAAQKGSLVRPQGV